MSWRRSSCELIMVHFVRSVLRGCHSLRVYSPECLRDLLDNEFERIWDETLLT
jgi:hypothetical protein